MRILNSSLKLVFTLVLTLSWLPSETKSIRANEIPQTLPDNPAYTGNHLFFPLVSLGDSLMSIGPGGGSITVLAIDPQNPMNMYAGTWGSGLFKSTDGGASWFDSSTGLPTLYIQSIAVDPTDSLKLYAGAYKMGVYKSTDGGGAWGEASQGLAENAVAYSMLVDPVNPSIVYAGVRNPPLSGGVYKSLDGGKSWQASSDGLQDDYIYDLAMDPKAHTTLYAASHLNGVYKSTDSGGSWRAVNSGIDDLSARALAINLINPAILYLGTWHGSSLYKTTNAAQSWSSANAGLNAAKVYALDIDPIAPDDLYAASLEGLYITKDGGVHWGDPWLSNYFIYSVAVNGKAHNIVYTGTAGDGLYKSPDGGGNWYKSDSGLNATSVTGVAVEPKMPATMYASVYGSGVMKTDDNGKTWVSANSGLDDKWVHTILMAPNDSLILFVGTEGNGVYRSRDGGASWRSINWGLPEDLNASWLKLGGINQSGIAMPVNPITGLSGPEAEIFADLFDNEQFYINSATGILSHSVLSIAIDPATPTTMYIGLRSQGVFISTDGGDSWKRGGLESETIYSLVVNPQHTEVLYAGTDGGSGSLLKSTNGGLNWSAKKAGLDDRTVFCLAFAIYGADPGQPDQVYAGTDQGVFKTINGGESWTLAGLGGQAVYALAIHPSQPDVLYAGTPGGLYRSGDMGRTWGPGNDELVGKAIQFITVEQGNARRVFIGTQANGAYQWYRSNP